MGAAKSISAQRAPITCLRIACIKLLTCSLLQFELCLPCFN